ncbi:MAG: repressor LexA [Candidatus Latescibacteria bacterium]|nr:repressor LexA [Candidatus Latescibacterota bacterium]
MAKALTERQASILNFIKDFAREHGYPPTIPEIQAEFGIKSPNGVNNHIKALTRKGYIKRDSSRARALDIIGRRDGIPILGRIAAGAPILAEENLEDHFTLEDMYRASDDVFILRVQGNSMINAGIYSGDYVLVRLQQSIEQGEIGVAIIDNEATVKRIYSDGNLVKLVPENDSMEPLTVMQTDPNFRIGGKVIGVIRRM